MIESIVGELLNNVENVETASGYENDTDTVDERGLPPHSIEIIVEGGDNKRLAEATLQEKSRRYSDLRKCRSCGSGKLWRFYPSTFQ